MIDITAARTRWSQLRFWEVDDVPTTDHHIVVTTVTMSLREKAPKRKSWATQKADWQTFRRVIDGYLHRHTLHTKSIEALNQTITESIMTAARKSVPRGRRPKEVAWWNEEVDDAIRRRKRAWNVFHASEKTEHKDKLAEQRRETDRVIC